MKQNSRGVTLNTKLRTVENVAYCFGDEAYSRELEGGTLDY